MTGRRAIIAFCLRRGEWRAQREVKRKRDFSSQKTLGGAEVSLRRPTASQERSGKKKSACCARNDRLGKPHEERRYRRLAGKDDSATRGKEGHDISFPYLDQGGTTPLIRA